MSSLTVLFTLAGILTIPLLLGILLGAMLMITLQSDDPSPQDRFLDEENAALRVRVQQLEAYCEALAEHEETTHDPIPMGDGSEERPRQVRFEEAITTPIGLAT